MSLESAVEKMIRNAIEAGEFDDLKGKGKPLNLKEYFSAPEDMRMAYSLLRSNDFVPEEVDLINKMADLRKKRSESVNEDEKRMLTQKLNECSLELNIALERRMRKAR